MARTGDHDEALRALIARATTDLEFRRRLLTDPHGAILEATGTSVSARIKFVEKDPDVDIQIVLPDYAAGGPELDIEDLDSVAGGTNWCELSCTSNTTMD